MRPWVMFGIHPLFGDYVDAIHSVGGHLSRIVLNIPEPERPKGERLCDFLDRYHDWLRKNGHSHEVRVEHLSCYSPDESEQPMLGFRGLKVLPLVEILQREFSLEFPPLVHRSACVSPMAKLGEGVFVGAGAIIASNATLGPFSLVNRGATIGHDSLVEQGVVIGPASNLASSVKIRAGAVLGIASTVIEKLEIGEGAYVAAGAVVLKDVPAHHLVAGVPATVRKCLQPNRTDLS